ncbi:hypothetical protein HJB80_08265 [Rhizobium lentis]|uniref:hypothetical protein n=1 Tax=Rhizobium lentis TaxID=1138194 RepID=UPI001C83A472|nr:hypothetical protein [Rhizobium lentis]MBX5132651.1 hypothetical protein [Rhizobium lentis]
MKIKTGEQARHTEEKFGVTVLRSVYGWYWVVAGSDADTTEELRELVTDVSRRDDAWWFVDRKPWTAIWTLELPDAGTGRCAMVSGMVSYALSTRLAQNEHYVFRAPENDRDLHAVLDAHLPHIRHVAETGEWPAQVVVPDEPPGGWFDGPQEKLPALQGPRRWAIDYGPDYRWRFVSDTECGYDLPERELHLFQAGDLGEWIVRIAEKTVQPWSNFARVSRFNTAIDLGHGLGLSYDQAREIGKLWMDGTEPEALGVPYEPRPEYTMRAAYERDAKLQPDGCVTGAGRTSTGG